MPSTDPQERRDIASIAGLTGWVNTPDRRARMAHVGNASPTGLKWHADKLGIDIEHCTEDELKRVETARTLWYRRLHLKTKAGRKAAQARKLAAEAERLEAVAAALEAHDAESGA